MLHFEVESIWKRNVGVETIKRTLFRFKDKKLKGEESKCIGCGNMRVGGCAGNSATITETPMA